MAIGDGIGGREQIGFGKAKGSDGGMSFPYLLLARGQYAVSITSVMPLVPGFLQPPIFGVTSENGLLALFSWFAGWHRHLNLLVLICKSCAPWGYVEANPLPLQS